MLAGVIFGLQALQPFRDRGEGGIRFGSEAGVEVPHVHHAVPNVKTRCAAQTMRITSAASSGNL